MLKINCTKKSFKMLKIQPGRGRRTNTTSITGWLVAVPQEAQTLVSPRDRQNWASKANELTNTRTWAVLQMPRNNVNVLKRTQVHEIKSHNGRQRNRHHRKAEDRGKSMGTVGLGECPETEKGGSQILFPFHLHRIK